MCIINGKSVSFEKSLCIDWHICFNKVDSAWCSVKQAVLLLDIYDKYMPFHTHLFLSKHAFPAFIYFIYRSLLFTLVGKAVSYLTLV